MVVNLAKRIPDGPRLRLVHRLKLPDAIQLATAVHEGCAALVTHDRDFAGVTDLPILGADRRG